VTTETKNSSSYHVSGIARLRGALVQQWVRGPLSQVMKGWEQRWTFGVGAGSS